MIEGISGVIIWTDDVDRLVTFYQHVLELEPNSVRQDFVSFKWGDIRLGIGKHSKVKKFTTEPFRIMVNLGVKDIQTTCRILKDRGVKFLRLPEKEHWGGWVGTFTDPDGNILQLLQQP